MFAYRPGSNILQNYLPVCIDDKNCLRLNKHALTVTLHNHDHHNSFKLVTNRVYTARINATYNSNFNMNKFVFNDGSEVLRDKRGLFVLVSSNTMIPKMYVPTTLDYNLGIATDTEFAGNDYFYNDAENSLQKISVEDFNAKYLKPFIQNIIDHAAQH